MSSTPKLILSIFLRLALFLAFGVTLLSIIAYARGYRWSAEDTTGAFKGITSTGIVSVSAFPQGSKVYVDGKLKGVTDLNISLPPGEYTIDVKKEGYTNWSKKIRLQGEIVLTLDALLFPTNPSLLSLSNLGVIKAIPYHEGNKVILFSQNEDEEKDGIYVYDASSRPVSFFAPLKIIVLKKFLPVDVNLEETVVHFSPDLQQAIFEFPALTGETYSYMFTLGEEVTQPLDISFSKDTLIASWEVSKNEEVTKILETFPKVLRPLVVSNFSIISFSPDQTKMLYQAKNDMQLPLIIAPPLIGSNPTPEERSIKKGQFYVYDKREDKNFHIDLDSTLVKNIPATSTPAPTIPRNALKTGITPVPTLADVYSKANYPIVWHSDSKHISIQHEKEIVMIDYDGMNNRTIYSGPFEPGFFFITNSGKLYILTNLNPQNNTYGDLYEIAIQ